MTHRFRFALALALLAAAPIASAQTATVTHATALREHPDAGARSIMEMRRRASVRILETQRDWIRVEADGQRSGWIPERDLDLSASEAFTALQATTLPNSPEQARALPRSLPRAANHALILPLGGASSPDAASATAIARLMGVPDANIQQPAAAALATPDGLREALAHFDARIGHGDRALLYLSGPGSQASQGGHCIETVLTPSGQPLGLDELARYTSALAQKAGRLVVLADTGRGEGQAPAGLTGRFVPASCRADAPRAIPAGHNTLVIRASRAGGNAFEDSRGGLATQALLACLDGRAALESRSGLPGGEDWRRCAQQQLDARPGKQQLSLAGNPALAPAPTRVPGDGAGPVKPAELLQALHAQRSEDRRVVAILAGGARQLTISGPAGGYLYVLGADDKGFTLLHPAVASVERFGGQATVVLPPGRQRILALVTEAPRNFLRAGFGGNGPYATAPADGRTLRDLPLELIEGDNSPACTRSETRNMGIEQARRCSTAFGSALVDVPAGR
ncbi:MAG: hypothetical protein JNL99_13635 [Zoogloea sp.]|nr:hypothetical protein [Zoogloea sp.]